MNDCIKGKLKAMVEAMATEPAYDKFQNNAFWSTHLDRLKFVSWMYTIFVFTNENIELMKEIVCHPNPKPFVLKSTWDSLMENRFLSQVRHSGCDDEP